MGEASFTNPFKTAGANSGNVNGGNGEVTIEPVCYVAGTRILTDRGEVAVEKLTVGDALVTESGAHRPVRWLSAYLEIALGEIERHEGSPARAHPDLEQAVYILEGEAIAGIDGVEHHVRPGDMMFFPAKVFHSIRALTERIKLLVIYSPSYGEDPAKVMHQPEGAAAKQ